MVSALMHMSPWVNWELEETCSKAYKIICMEFEDGPPRLTLPPLAQQLSLPWYAWDHDQLAQLIDAK